MSHIVGRIIVGVSGSPGSLQALRHAVSRAQTYGATLVPVLAWVPPGGESAYRRYPVPELAGEWAKAAEQRLLTAFDEGLGGLPADLRTTALVVRGPAGAVLVAAADRDNDLLVIGTGRRGTLRHRLHASVARYCLAHAQCTVIAVPPNPLADDIRRVWTGLRLRRAPHDGADALEPANRAPRPHRDRIRLTGPDQIDH